jgi:WD40 repeat protein
MFTKSASPVGPIPRLTVAHWQLRDLLCAHPSSDSPYLYTISSDSVVRIDRIRKTSDIIEKYSFSPVSLTCSPSGIVACGGNEGELALGSHVLSLGGRFTTNGLGFAPHTSNLYVACNDSTVKVYDVASARCVKSVAFRAPINYVKASPTGSMVACVGDSYDVNVLDADGHRIKAFRNVFADAGFALSFDAHGHTLVCGSQKGQIALFDLRMMALVKVWDRIGRIQCVRVMHHDVAFAGTADMLAVAEQRGLVTILDTRAYEMGVLHEISAGEGDRCGSAGVAWTDDQLWCAWTDQNERVSVYDVDRRRRRQCPGFVVC